MIEQTEIGGGILADEMGMGKSLSVLALILRTLGAAHEWSVNTGDKASRNTQALTSRSYSSGTLIVASSDRTAPLPSNTDIS
jgi:SWI/SNF-related matrix-associated actin-dependent regulator of chromatin subfamily A3